MSELTVICCRSTASAEGRAAASGGIERGIVDILKACGRAPIEFVGPRPGKAIDQLLAGRILVVGDDADLAAVALRLLRKGLLADVEVGYATPTKTAFSAIWRLPTGPAAVQTALRGEVDLVPLVRDDVGGVLVGSGRVGPMVGLVYVDEHKVLSGAAALVEVEPDQDKGLAVTVVRRRFLGIGRRPTTKLGRAVEFRAKPATGVVRDGVRYPREMDRWVFYKHTEPLRLVRGLY